MSGRHPRVVVRCDECGQTKTIAIRIKKKVINNQMTWICRKCSANKPERIERSRQAALDAWKCDEYRARISRSSQELWKDQDFRKMMHDVRSSKEFKDKVADANRAKVNDKFRKKCSENATRSWKDENYRKNIVSKVSASSKRNWKDNNYRKKMLDIFKKRWDDANYRSKIAEAMAAKWQNPAYRNKMLSVFCSDEFRAKMSDAVKELWGKPDYRYKMTKILATTRSKQQRVSNIQQTLYAILDDLGIKYFREYEGHCDKECIIGPYVFDCVIPRREGTTLLVECQGEYYHSVPKNIARDKAKASYISNNFGATYELKYLWEHEFSCPNKISNLLSYWTGAKLKTINFNINNLEIKKCSSKESRSLLSKYHYLPNSGRGGMSFGAYLDNKLVAVCVFSHPIRQNVKIENFRLDQIRELSRFCIHPQYQKKNLGSWFISKCVKLLPDKYKAVVSYCDTTYNHDGAVYKASNFKLDGEVRPDYWYVSEDGWVMHKRTLYRHATKMGMRESEYAKLFLYTKVWGKKKLRFVRHI